MAQDSYVVVDGKPFKLGPLTTAGDLKRAVDAAPDTVGVYTTRDGENRVISDDRAVLPNVPSSYEIRFEPVTDMTAPDAVCPECGGRVEFSDVFEQERCTACGLVIEDETEDGEDEADPATKGLGELFG